MATREAKRWPQVVAALVILSAGFGVGWWFRGDAGEGAEESGESRARRAVVQFEVSSAPLRLTRDTQHDEREWRTFKATQVAYLESPIVLMGALGASGGEISRLSVFKGLDGEEQMAWLREHLKARYPSDGELLEVTVEHPDAPKEELLRIVEAVAKSYYDQVVFEQSSARARPTQILQASHNRLAEKIAIRNEALVEMERDNDAGVRAERQLQLWMAEISRLAERKLLAEERLLESRLAEAAAAGEQDKDEADEGDAEPDRGEVASVLEEQVRKYEERIDELNTKVLDAPSPEAVTEGWRHETQQLQAVADEVYQRIQLAQIDAQAPGRVRTIGGPNHAPKGMFYEADETDYDLYSAARE